MHHDPTRHSTHTSIFRLREGEVKGSEIREENQFATP